MGTKHVLASLLTAQGEPTAPPNWRNARLGDINGSVVLHAGGGQLEGSWHRQDSDECLIVVSGEVTVVFDDGPITGVAGECILIEAHERHRVLVPDQALLVAIESVDATRLAP